MKKLLFGAFVFLGCALFLSSCEKDGGKLPNIEFKTGSGYVSANDTLLGGTSFTIGISASKAEDRDVLKSFNISRSVNGGAAATVYSQSLSGSNGDNYTYDFNTVADTTSGLSAKYTFTVTNRDGLTNQVSLTVVSE
jgi:hypothetical protein